METQSTDRDTSSKNKKELQAFIGIINYLSKFSPGRADVCEALRQLTSAKAEWAWNATYQKLFNRAKIHYKGKCMNQILK